MFMINIYNNLKRISFSLPRRIKIVIRVETSQMHRLVFVYIVSSDVSPPNCTEKYKLPPIKLEKTTSNFVVLIGRRKSRQGEG